MKNKELTRRIMALAMAAALSVSVSPVVYAAERADAQTIKEDNQPAADAEESAEEAEGTAEEGTKTEYPLTITTYDYDGNEIETTYEKAPEKVIAVYQGHAQIQLFDGHLQSLLLVVVGLLYHDLSAGGLVRQVDEQVQVLGQHTGSQRNGFLCVDRAIGPNLNGQLVVINGLSNTGALDVIIHLEHRGVNAVNGKGVDIVLLDDSLFVALCGHIATALVEGELHDDLQRAGL